jgi:hypothetical protein
MMHHLAVVDFQLSLLLLLSMMMEFQFFAPLLLMKVFSLS